MCGFEFLASTLSPWERELSAELGGITLFEDAIPTLTALRPRCVGALALLSDRLVHENLRLE